MMQPVTLTWRNAVPTGLGFEPSRYLYSQRTREANPLTGMHGVGGLGLTNQQITGTVGTAAAFIPVVGPFIAAAAQLAIVVETLFAGCGQSCVQTSNAANQAAAQLTQLFNQYMAAPVHYASMQAAYVQAFNQLWAQLTQVCSNPQFGAAGQRCITDRQRGGCTWKVNAFGWQQNADGTFTYISAGSAGSGSTCWNWFVGLLDPIANDPTVVPDPILGSVDTTDAMTGTTTATGSTTAAGATTTTTTGTNNIMPLLLIGAGLFILLEML